MKFTTQDERNQSMVSAFYQDGHSQTAIALAFGLSSSTVRRVVMVYKNGERQFLGNGRPCVSGRTRQGRGPSDSTISRISPAPSSASSASARATIRRAQDCLNEWQDCPNAVRSVGARICMRVRAGGFTHVLLQDLTPETSQAATPCGLRIGFVDTWPTKRLVQSPGNSPSPSLSHGTTNMN